MIRIPQNYPGPNAAGTVETEIPYYTQGHVAGNYPKDVAGPWACGTATDVGPVPETPEPEHWAKYIFNYVRPTDVIGIFLQYYGGGEATIDWGDGTVETADGYIEHAYSTPGQRTIYISGDTPGELTADIYYDGGVDYYSANLVEVNVPDLTYLYVYGWPSSMTLNCEGLSYFYFGPYSTNYNIAGYAPLVNAVLSTLTNLYELDIYGVLSGPLDLRNCPNLYDIYVNPQFANATFQKIYTSAGQGLFDFYPSANTVLTSVDCTASTSLNQFYCSGSCTINEVTGINNKTSLQFFGPSNSETVYGLQSLDLSGNTSMTYTNLNMPDLVSLNLNDCSSLTLQTWNAPKLAHVQCNNTSYETMGDLLDNCAEGTVTNGTFSATGNGAPADQLATWAATLVSRGWTVTTD